MTATKSIKRPRPDKPSKDFPLFAHASGQWAKKIRGKLCYFGVWAEPEAARRRYERQRFDLEAGRKPRPLDVQTDGIDVATMCNHFLTSKRRRVEAGELKERTWREYHATCQRLTRVFGRERMVSDLRADDFSALRNDISKTYNPTSVANEVNRVRVICKYAWDAELTEKPLRYGPDFKRPSAKTLRIELAKNGKRMYSPEQLHTLLEAASKTLRAMILLGVNCGYGNADCGQLRHSHVDIDGGWVEFPRPKTGIQRRAKLWIETIDAMQSAWASRQTPKHKSDEQLWFITKRGLPWHKDGVADSPVSKEFRKLADATGVYRRGLSFYTLRHTFATVAGETRDQVAVNAAMGHVDTSMAGVYREHISDDRLEAVADHVRQWLFGQEVR